MQGEKGKSEEEVAPINSAAAQAAGATSNETSSSIIPEYVNEPFAVALITTFAAIILQAGVGMIAITEISLSYHRFFQISAMIVSLIKQN